MKAVKIHCGSSHVAGKARRYRYFVASVFETYVTKDGRSIWRNTGTSTRPHRSLNLTEKEAIELAHENNASFMVGYGSLHNKIFAQSPKETFPQSWPEDGF